MFNKIAKSKMFYSDRGSAALALLSISLLIGLLALSIIRYSWDNINAWRNQLLHTRCANNATSRALELTNQNNSSCSTSTAKNGRIQLLRQICAIKINNDPFLIQPLIIAADSMLPLIDYNAIFKDSFSCHLPTPTADLLTNDAVVAKSTCNNRSSNSKAIKLRGNLIQALPLTIDLGTEALIAATGFIRLQDVLTIKTDTLIIAGGDLEITNLIAACPTSCQITLISGSGKVSLLQSGGNAAFRVWSFVQPDLAVIPSSQTNPLLPPITAQILLGVRQLG